jgi:predicted GNAT family acetyltransferase
MASIDIHHLPEHNRFEALVEGQSCVLDYTLSAGRMVIRHTGVPSAVGGRGIGGALVQAAMEWARAAGLRVLPRCSYASAYLERHREFDDIVDRD